MDNNLLSFIPQDLLIIIAASYVLGVYLKQSKCPDKYIPTVLIIFCIIFSLLTRGLSATSIMQGILCWGVSIGINQMKKQYTKDDDNNQLN